MLAGHLQNNLRLLSRHYRSRNGEFDARENCPSEPTARRVLWNDCGPTAFGSRWTNSKEEDLHDESSCSFTHIGKPLRICGDCRRAGRKCGQQIRWHVERCVSHDNRTVPAGVPRRSTGGRWYHGGRGCHGFPIRTRFTQWLGEGHRLHGGELWRRIRASGGQFRQRNMARSHGKRELRRCVDRAATVKPQQPPRAWVQTRRLARAARGWRPPPVAAQEGRWKTRWARVIRPRWAPLRLPAASSLDHGARCHLHTPMMILPGEVLGDVGATCLIRIQFRCSAAKAACALPCQRRVAGGGPPQLAASGG
jgi:hypothetical protein